MKKFITLLVLITTFSNAEFEIFQTTSGTPITQDNNTTEVYFGEYRSFGKNLKEGSKGAMFQGLFGGITNGISGAGFGLIIGFLDPFVLSTKMDQKYLKVERLEDAEGNIGFRKTMFIGAKGGVEYSEEEIKNLIKEYKGSKDA